MDFADLADAADVLQARQRFAQLLVTRLPCPAEVRWHANRVHLASASRRQGRLVLRLHGLFAAGDAHIAQDLADFLYRRERACAARLKRWFDARAPAVRAATSAASRGTALAATPKLAPASASVATSASLAAPASAAAAASALETAATLSPATAPVAAPPGARVHCPFLQGLFDRLNADYFHRGCRASIRWGRAGVPQRRRRKSMQLGCYDFARQEIRIHPALRRPEVPDYVVGMVVYHEMLHEVFGLEMRGGRRLAHPPEFRACESSHPDYARARAWEALHLHQLLAWRA